MKITDLTRKNKITKMNYLALLFLLSVFFSTCTKETPVMEEEKFEASNRPFFRYDGKNNYFYCLPWNYETQINSSREYPLVIYLHGSGGAGNIQHLNYLGYDSDNGIDDQKAISFQTNYPGFVLIPQTNDGSWDGNQLANLVEDFKKNYRIDQNRIYLIGYSMGGSGSYIFANDYYDFNRHLFAGIVRLAGQSQTILRDEIAEKTAVWLHIGLNDEPIRVDITREAYDFLKSKHPDAEENIEVFNTNGRTGTTYSLKESGSEKIKRTEYNNTGHDINIFPFENDSIINWLFRQKIK